LGGHVPEFRPLLRRITDIDLIGYLRQMDDVERLMEEMGFGPLKGTTLSLMSGRSAFATPDRAFRVDVFYDKLEMCHTIELKDRLELDYPTITLVDLLLEKLQIVQINEKDILDCLNLIRLHDVSESDTQGINAKHLAGLLSSNWGFHHTVELNLDKLLKYQNSFESLTAKDREDIKQKTDKLREYMEKEPKSLGWRMRAKVGEKKIWYNDVEFRE
jgi:hypothetical protein